MTSEGAGITAMLRRLGCNPKGLAPAVFATTSPQAPAALMTIEATSSPAAVFTRQSPLRRSISCAAALQTTCPPRDLSILRYP